MICVLRQRGRSCLTSFPQGYCSETCEGQHKCPEDTHCIMIEYGGNNGALEGAVCLVKCGAALPACRECYKCLRVGETLIQVCFPE